MERQITDSEKTFTKNVPNKILIVLYIKDSHNKIRIKATQRKNGHKLRAETSPASLWRMTTWHISFQASSWWSWAQCSYSHLLAALLRSERHICYLCPPVLCAGQQHFFTSKHEFSQVTELIACFPSHLPSPSCFIYYIWQRKHRFSSNSFLSYHVRNFFLYCEILVQPGRLLSFSFWSRV